MGDDRPKSEDFLADTVVVEVTDIARGGAGVARDTSGRVIFIPYTAPGDLVRVRITEEKKKYAQGELVELLRKSPERQVPPCPAFGKCGGCQWQHLSYPLQWKTKSRGVRHALSRVQLEVTQWDEFPAEQIWEYRNRVQLRGEGAQLGYYAAGSHDIVPVERCDIARAEINASWGAIRQEGAAFTRPYKVELAVNEKGELTKAWNRPHGAAGFRQIHDAQNAKLQQWIVDRLEPSYGLIDLYGGSGNLSVGMAGKMAEIHCVDVGAPRTPPPGAPANLHFHRSAVVPWLVRNLPRVVSRGAPWVAIVDPPREGLAMGFAEIAGSLEKAGIRELIAVGCDPDAWARDVSRFLRREWVLERAAVFDFFPQTPHIESAAHLRRRGSKS